MRVLVYTLRYKLVLIICALITGAHPALGDINASKYYADHTRTFLGYLGHENPSMVPIRKMSRNDPLYGRVSGYANGIAIYLNEDVFARDPEGVNLYVCAHEAAHYTLGHAYQAESRGNLEIEQEADVTAARMLCKHGYTWAVEQQVNMLKRLINAGRGEWSDGKHPSNQQEYEYLSKVLKTERKNMHLKTGIEKIKDLLCEFNNLSQEEKIAIAGTIIISIIGCYLWQ
jgi:hypothetical protein